MITRTATAAVPPPHLHERTAQHTRLTIDFAGALGGCCDVSGMLAILIRWC